MAGPSSTINHPGSGLQLSEGPSFLSSLFGSGSKQGPARVTECGISRSLIFLTFHFETISDLQGSYKNSTENSHYSFHPDSSNVTMLHNQGAMIKIRKLTCLQYYYQIYRSYLNFANSIVSFNLEEFLSLALFFLEAYWPVILQNVHLFSRIWACLMFPHD